MRVGGCTFAFGPKPLEEACRSLKELGFRIVDLGVCLGNTQINPFDASENPGAVADTVNRCLDDLGLERGECFVLDFGQPFHTDMPANLTDRLCGRGKHTAGGPASTLVTSSRAVFRESIQQRGSPLTPSPSPTLGRGEPMLATCSCLAPSSRVSDQS